VTPKKVKITGSQGDWTVDVEGTRLAVIHDYWYSAPSTYFDPMKGAKVDGKRYADYLAALRANDRVVMQKSATDGSFARLGYIGIFKFKDLVVDEDTGSISLTLTQRLPVKPA
jgi:hypothetical protein